MGASRQVAGQIRMCFLVCFSPLGMAELSGADLELSWAGADQPLRRLSESPSGQSLGFGTVFYAPA